MVAFFDKLLSEIQLGLDDLHHLETDPLRHAGAALDVLLPGLTRLQAYVLQHGFASEQEEIHFFKSLKPQLTSRLLYFHKVYLFEARRPQGGDSALRTFVEEEFAKIRHFFLNNRDFYQYYRTGDCSLDDHYFVRGKHIIKNIDDSNLLLSDGAFSTSHDHKVARLLAYEGFESYLQRVLAPPSSPSVMRHRIPLKWTGPKIALVELVYALHSAGCVMDGKADLTAISSALETTFDVSLGQVSRMFIDLRARKTDRTRFLDELKEVLLERMEEADGG